MCQVFDEVKIKEDLVFDKHSLELVGFVQIGDINSHLSKFQSCNMPQQSTTAPQLATHMVSFMVSGIMMICSSLMFHFHAQLFLVSSCIQWYGGASGDLKHVDLK